MANVRVLTTLLVRLAGDATVRGHEAPRDDGPSSWAWEATGEHTHSCCHAYILKPTRMVRLVLSLQSH
jgi:hypothetical protein